MRNLAILLAVLACGAWAGPTFRCTAYLAWDSAAPVTINTADSSLMRLVYVPKSAASTGNDYAMLRFADDSGHALSHWLYDTTTKADTAMVWVGLRRKMGDGEKIWLYGKNASAAQASNCEAAFCRPDSTYWSSDFARGQRDCWQAWHDTVVAEAGGYASWPTCFIDTTIDTVDVVYRIDSADAHEFSASGALCIKSAYLGANDLTWSTQDTLYDSAGMDERTSGGGPIDSAGVGIRVVIVNMNDGGFYPYVAALRSKNRGAWTGPYRITPDDESWYSHANIVQLSDGRILTAAYDGQPLRHAHVYISSDYGVTWAVWGQATSPDTTHQIGEPQLVLLENAWGQFVGGVALIGRANLANLVPPTIMFSTDSGKTFGDTAYLPWKIDSESNPPWVARRVPHGPIIAMYGHGDNGGDMYESYDECRTWTRYRGNWFNDGYVSRSYPCWAPLDSGMIGVAYAKNSTASNVYFQKVLVSPGAAWSSNGKVLPTITDGAVKIIYSGAAQSILGQLKINGTAIPLIFEMRMQTSGSSRNGIHVATAATIGIEDDGTNTVYAINSTDAFQTTIDCPTNRYFRLGIMWKSDSIQVDTNGVKLLGKNAKDGSGITTGQGFAYVTEPGSGDYTDIDWVYIRPYTATLPLDSLGAMGSPITLDSIRDTTGTAAGGDTIRWYGTGFGASTGSATLCDSSVTVVSWSDTLVVSISVAGVASTGNAVLTDAGSNTATLTNGWTYTAVETADTAETTTVYRHRQYPYNAYKNNSYRR